MAIININRLVQDFRDALGWPYVSPGTNDERGIDCSGMFVRAYKLQGASIYHGSNTIWRSNLSEKGRIVSTNQLQVGMAVFKNRDWTEKDSKNKWYNKDADGNMYHIGLVVSVNPVRIIHASTNGMCVREDPYSKAWTHWGKLNNADYNGYNGTQTEVNNMKTMYVYSENGGNVNMRAAMSTTSGQIIAKIPSKTPVTFLSDEGAWARIEYNGKTGFMRSEFLKERLPDSNATSGTTKEKLQKLIEEISRLVDSL